MERKNWTYLGFSDRGKGARENLELEWLKTRLNARLFEKWERFGKIQGISRSIHALGQSGVICWRNRRETFNSDFFVELLKQRRMKVDNIWKQCEGSGDRPFPFYNWKFFDFVFCLKKFKFYILDILYELKRC